MMIEITCCNCGDKFHKQIGHVNRANKHGLNIYCNRTCAGIGRRNNRTDEENKKIKADYDKKYRQDNLETLKAKKHEWFKENYNPEKAAVERKKRAPQHAEYCRQPEYKKWKQQYDLAYHAKKNFGEFWESALLILDIEKEYEQAEIRQINNLHNKSQKRKRKWRQLQKLNYLLAT